MSVSSNGTSINHNARVQACFRICHQEGLHLTETHQLLVYADDFNMLSKNIHTIKTQKTCYRLVGRLVWK